MDRLHAQILGDSVRKVSNIELVTIDASSSNNPNEPQHKQNQIIYTWTCDVYADTANCAQYNTSSKILLVMNNIRDQVCTLEIQREILF